MVTSFRCWMRGQIWPLCRDECKCGMQLENLWCTVLLNSDRGLPSVFLGGVKPGCTILGPKRQASTDASVRTKLGANGDITETQRKLILRLPKLQVYEQQRYPSPYNWRECTLRSSSVKNSQERAVFFSGPYRDTSRCKPNFTF